MDNVENRGTQAQGELRRLQQIELEILREFIQVCRRHGLRYFVLYGSCIGAVRHGGFIPWDDDIDVGMPRPDYEEFLKVAQAELPEKYFIQTGRTDPDCTNTFAKIRNSETCFIEKSNAKYHINHGVFIDIFPLDGFNGDKGFLRKKKLYEIQLRHTVDAPYPSKLKKAVCLLAGALTPDYRKVRDKLAQIITQKDYDESEIVGSYCGWPPELEMMPKEVFGNGTPVPFEGMTVLIPEKYDAYLRQLYGDYMTPPPEEKRVTNHAYTVIDLDRSYREYEQKGKGVR